MVLGSAVALPCVQDGKVKVVKELKSYQVQPNCTVKYSMYCELDGLQFEQELPSPAQTTKEQASCESQSNESSNATVTAKVPSPVQTTKEQESFKSVSIESSSATVTVTVTTTATVFATPTPSPIIVFKTCQHALSKGHRTSGVYTIQPDSLPSFDVYCDMVTDGGGWTVFQRRQDGSVNFYRNWNNYTAGFGNLSGEFWLGLNYIHRLTSGGSCELRVDLEDFSEERRFANFSSFQVGNSSTGYTIQIGGYSGSAGDSLSSTNELRFSTFDHDRDTWYKNCAVTFKGAWWYSNCHSSNLNGRYLRGTHASYADGVNWYTWKGHHYSLKFTEMKTR
jgi:ficolin